MTQQIINVGAAPNDGQGDPIRTAFTKCNNNFDELYSRVQVDPPSTLIGSIGDVAGMTAYDEDFYYYCFQDFDGSSQIWNKVPQTGNAQVTILTATGNIVSGGNISANYFSGDGSGLTNVAAGAPTSVVNGTSNIVINASSNINMAVGSTPMFTLTKNAANAATPQGLIIDGFVWARANTPGGISGNVIGGNLRATAGNILACATPSGSGGYLLSNNITNNNLITTNTISLTGNVTSNLNITLNETIGGNLTVIGNILGNPNASGTLTAQNLVGTGNVTAGGFFIGDGQYLTNITAVSNVAVTQIANGSSVFAVVGTGANITGTVGGTLVITLSSSGANVVGYIDATGNIDGANLNSDGRILAVANITGGNLTTGGKVVASGNVDGLNLNATQQVIATGNITGGNLITLGLISATGNITGGNLTGTLITGTLTTAAQPNITSVGTLTSLTVSGNITGGNLISTGLGSFGTTLTATGNITGGNLITLGLISATGNITGNGLVSTNGVTATGNVDGGNLNTGGRVLATGNVTGGNLTTGGLIVTTGNIDANNVIATSTISATGNITGGNLSVGTGTITVNNILNGGANATGNIGNSTNYFNTVFAKATSAQYADLAENYLADAEYAPGTVLSFGGTAEVTQSNQDHDPLIVGVVSTNPAYQMNSELKGENVVTVALVGRVPCRVQGPVTRGAMMVSAGNGIARAETQPAMGTVIGKALEDFDGDQGTIEIVVGRL